MIAGKPLIAWTIQEALKSKWIDRYVVSTESTEVAEIAEQYGAEVVMRPKELAQDDTPSLDALLDTVGKVEGDWDAVVMLPCTNPLKTVADIDGAIGVLMNEDIDSVIGVSEAYPVERIKRITGGYLYDVLEEPQDGQRQLLPRYYIRNGSVYAVKRTALSRLFGHLLSKPWIMPKNRSVNIDDEVDWKLAEVLLNDLGS